MLHVLAHRLSYPNLVGDEPMLIRFHAECILCRVYFMPSESDAEQILCWLSGSSLLPPPDSPYLRTTRITLS